VLRHLKWSDVGFPKRQKQDVFAAASKDGFTAVRKANAAPRPSRRSRQRVTIHAIHGGPEKKYRSALYNGANDNFLATYSGRFIFLRYALYRGSPFSEFNKGALLICDKLTSFCLNALSSHRNAASLSRRDAWICAIPNAFSG
jgi:hypothetical protein